MLGARQLGFEVRTNEKLALNSNTILDVIYMKIALVILTY